MIDLKPFCGRNDPRTELNQPWCDGGFTYASNAHLAIKIVGERPKLPGAPSFAKQLARFFEEAHANSVPLPIEFPSQAEETCETCNGKKYTLFSSCGDCSGNGSFEHGQHDYECKECEGSGGYYQPARESDEGSEDCMTCGGRGTTSRYIYLVANGITHGYQEKYLRLIAALPNVRFFVTDDNTRCARFDFDGGSGVLMPVRI